MDVLKIPTDNLYKFLAVSGLVMFLGCAYLAFFQEQALEQKWTNYTVETKNTALQISNLRDEVGGLVLPRIFDLANAGKKERAAELLKKYEENEDKLKEQNITKAIQDAFSVYLNKETKKIGFIILMLRIGSVAGLFFSLLGFLGWYFRVQRYLDKKLKLESEK